jgi:hypothetical protein
MLATGLPPGWIELAAFRDEATMRSFLDEQLAADGEAFTTEQRSMVGHACAAVFGLVRPQRWLHLGAVVTQVPGEAADWRTTVWTVGVGVMPLPESGDVDPIAVAERVLGRMDGVEASETFRLDDGRHGIVLAMTTSVDLSGLDFDPLAYLPQLDPQALGVYLCLLPVPGLPEHVGVTIGVAPNRTERGPMSFLAGQMATSLHAVTDPTELPSAHVLVDTTGRVHAEGFLRAGHPGGTSPGGTSPGDARTGR